jgi:diguanylate cyclase (GGDEF)-like protein
VVVVPLTAEGGSVGAVVLEHGTGLGGRIERRVVSTVERFCSHAALALRNASLVDQLRDMAATDGLTAVANRRTFEAALEVELTRAARSGSSLSLVLIDIDHFKSLNDTHGHQAGDEVLRAVARAIKDQSRAFDTPARYGGEEFAVIMPGCDVADAERGAERFRQAVGALDGISRVTVSAGVATFPVHAADADSLVQMADAALYESKGAGRNRTTVAHPTLAEGADQLLSDLEPTVSPAGDAEIAASEGEAMTFHGQPADSGVDSTQSDSGSLIGDVSHDGESEAGIEDQAATSVAEEADPAVSNDGDDPGGDFGRGATNREWQ